MTDLQYLNDNLRQLIEALEVFNKSIPGDLVIDSIQLLNRDTKVSYSDIKMVDVDTNFTTTIKNIPQLKKADYVVDLRNKDLKFSEIPDEVQCQIEIPKDGTKVMRSACSQEEQTRGPLSWLIDKVIKHDRDDHGFIVTGVDGYHIYGRYAHTPNSVDMIHEYPYDIFLLSDLNFYSGLDHIDYWEKSEYREDWVPILNDKLKVGMTVVTGNRENGDQYHITSVFRDAVFGIPLPKGEGLDKIPVLQSIYDISNLTENTANETRKDN